MSNDTVRANAQAMPRRLFLAAGPAAAVFATLRGAKANGIGIADPTHPYAELLALSHRARALALEYAALDVKVTAALEQMEKPPVPKTLICREEDMDFFTRQHLHVGKPFFPVTYKEAKTVLALVPRIFRDICRNGRAVDERTTRYIGRSLEIAQDSEAYEAAYDAARKAAGVTALNEEIERVDTELSRTYRAIALRPAKTVDGVLAKLAACGDRVAEAWPLDPDEEGEVISISRVGEAAAIDYAGLLKAREV